MQGFAIAPIRRPLFALSASLLLLACQSQPEHANTHRANSRADSSFEQELAPTSESPSAPPKTKPASQAPELARTQPPLLDAESILEREARNERLRARRYAAAIERAQSEDLAGQAISAVRSYRDALTFAPNPSARAEIKLRVRSLMEQALLRDQAQDQLNSGDAEDGASSLVASTEASAGPSGLATMPPLPDYRGLNEEQLDLLCAASGPAARVHKAMGGASSFIAQAQALLGPGLSANLLAHERYEAFKAGEALLASHQSLKRELEERLSYSEFRRWDEAWLAGTNAQGLDKPRRIERIQLVERTGQLCDELVASLRFLTWTSINLHDRFGNRSHGFRLQTRTLSPAECQAVRVHCAGLIEKALRQRKGSGLTIVEGQTRAMAQASNEALDEASLYQRRFELNDLLAALDGTALP
jgi:hypothetical protein